MHESRQNGDQELIDELAVAAAETGSDLYYLVLRARDGNRLPGGVPLAAVFRY